jgi:hypothetical protein
LQAKVAKHCRPWGLPANKDVPRSSRRVMFNPIDRLPAKVCGSGDGADPGADRASTARCRTARGCSSVSYPPGFHLRLLLRMGNADLLGCLGGLRLRLGAAMKATMAFSINLFTTDAYGIRLRSDHMRGQPMTTIQNPTFSSRSTICSARRCRSHRQSYGAAGIPFAFCINQILSHVFPIR